jgi:2-keto-4-pentenoate hydratase/2-oxohepta-3-ene-1,7-dioic acid hydratase in catechol pathway
MRLVTFQPKRGEPARVGVLAADGSIVDLKRAAKSAGVPLPFDPTSMLDLIRSGRAGLAATRKATAKAKGHHAADKVRLLAPIPRPTKNVFCVGWNYLEHFKEGEKIRPNITQLPDFPVFFTKCATAVCGPRDPIPFDAKVTEKLDWEVELGVILGRAGKNIAEADAMKHVFGYTVINDVSGRDIQRRHGNQWFKGKSLDASCPMGPWIVTADEVDPTDLRVITRVNGVVKQDSNTSHMYFKIPRIVAELSVGMTLEPGDIIASGTPEGVGHARNPPEFMSPGDVLETEIVGLGMLHNPIVDVARPR